MKANDRNGPAGEDKGDPFSDSDPFAKADPKSTSRSTISTLPALPAIGELGL